MAATITLQNIIETVINSVINPLVPVLVGVALLIFAFGLFKYTKSGYGQSTDIQGAKSLMFWGVIILFVILSVWGLVGILQKTFFGSNLPKTVPIPEKYDLF